MEPEAYRETAAAEASHFWFRELRWIWKALLRAGAGPSGSGVLLDVGCGTGGNLGRLPARWRGVGIDRSPIALDLSRRIAGCPLVRGAIAALPFRDGSVDAALCLDVIYHRAVRDDIEALREIRRVLKPGGIAVINVPAFEALRSSHDAAVHTARRYDRGMLRERLIRAGLEPVRVLYWNGLLLPASALVRLLRRGRGAKSDIASPHPFVNAILSAIGWIDSRLALVGILPAGLSVIALARRPE